MGETQIRSTIVGVEGGRADERFILNGTAKPHMGRYTHGTTFMNVRHCSYERKIEMLNSFHFVFLAGRPPHQNKYPLWAKPRIATQLLVLKAGGPPNNYASNSGFAHKGYLFYMAGRLIKINTIYGRNSS